jgi:hypothetical protein
MIPLYMAFFNLLQWVHPFDDYIFNIPLTVLILDIVLNFFTAVYDKGALIESNI